MKKFFITGMLSTLLIGCGAESIDVSKVPERGFYSTRAASKWEESLVTGNGTMGIMVEGNPYRESVVFNHALLYLPLHKPLKPVSQGKYLNEIRQMMLERKFGEASRFVVDLANSEGYTGKHATDLFIPAFRLDICGDSTKVADYRRTVDFSTGEVEVKWQDKRGTFSRQFFVSRPDNVIVIRLKSSDGSRIDNVLDLSQITTCDPGRVKKFALDEKLGIEKIESKAFEGGLSFRAWYERPWNGSFKGYEGVVKVVRSDGEVRAENGKLFIEDASDVLLLARVEPSSDMEHSSVENMLSALEKLPADYDELLSPHKKIHGELFGRVSLDLNAQESDRQKSCTDRENLRCGSLQCNMCYGNKSAQSSRYLGSNDDAALVG